MNTNIPIHDGTITKYNADFSAQTLELVIDDNVSNMLTVLFNDLLTFKFTDISICNIISEIMETDIKKFIVFEKKSIYAWPYECDTEEKIEQYLKENNYHCFTIYSSLGLNGIIIAKSVGFTSTDADIK